MFFLARRRDSDEDNAEGLILLIVLVAIISFFRKVREGELWAILTLIGIILIACGIAFLYIRHKLKKRKYKRSIDLQTIDKMSGREFEEYLASMFKKLGYSVQLTPASQDYGADLVLKKDQKRIVVQAKRYNNKVGIAAVQEIYSSQKLYKADEAWIVTNNHDFTSQAKILAKKNDVVLINRARLYEFIEQSNQDQFSKRIRNR